MNSKVAKKIRKETRKEAREIFGEGMNVMSTFIRRRPRFIPRCVWILLYMPVFKAKTWKHFYKYI